MFFDRPHLAVNTFLKVNREVILSECIIIHRQSLSQMAKSKTKITSKPKSLRLCTESYPRSLYFNLSSRPIIITTDFKAFKLKKATNVACCFTLTCSLKEPSTLPKQSSDKAFMQWRSHKCISGDVRGSCGNHMACLKSLAELHCDGTKTTGIRRGS